MDLKEHYESYRASVRKDIPDGAQEYAKIIRLADGQLLSDWLRKEVIILSDCINIRDTAGYRSHLVAHQEAMIGLLERYTSTLKFTGLDLIEKHGWRAFRFSKVSILLHGDKPQVWIPRYPTAIQEVCFDAIEMGFLMGKKSPLVAEEAYGLKVGWPGQRFIPVGDDRVWTDQADVNTTAVDDWTYRLFL
jgi:hypothetical protein